MSAGMERHFAKLAGIPDSVTDDQLFTFSDLLKNAHDAEHAKMHLTRIQNHLRDLDDKSNEQKSHMKKLEYKITHVLARMREVEKKVVPPQTKCDKCDKNSKWIVRGFGGFSGDFREGNYCEEHVPPALPKWTPETPTWEPS